jgi:phosphoglycerol transferase MdoB-like AlkP superfamily enzyme
MDQIIDYFNATPAPCCVMGITVSGHMPFDLHPDNVAVPDTMPVLFQHYLQTAHFTDRQLGRLLSWADTASVMRNATVVITGDHRIFHAWINDEIREYGLRANLPFGVCYAGCPLIIAGPEIHARTLPHAQQVDIFTTTLQAIGQDNYFWHGTGRNLLEDSEISESEANLRRQISDKLIRTDYFGQIE